MIRPLRTEAAAPLPAAQIAPLPRVWKGELPPVPTGFVARTSGLFSDHARAVNAVLLGASAIGSLGIATPALAADMTRVSSESLAHDVLFRPSAHDVATTSKDTLTSLEKSTSGADRRLAATIKNAREAYADLISGGARVIVTPAQGNGGQPVLVLIPAAFDASKPAEVHTHYHGWRATVADLIGSEAGTGARMRAVQAENPQTIFVLPECQNAPAKRGSYQTDWKNVRSQAETTEQALAAAGISDVSLRVVSAHSGGGSALAHAITRNPDGSGLRADRLELLDSLYGSEAQVRTWAGTANGHAVKDVVYHRGTNDAGKDTHLPGAFGARYSRVQMSGPDPHNHTVRGFMHSP